MATLAHALQLVGGWIAPLIIFLVKRQSRFVSFHALQALLFQIIHVIVMVVVVMVWFIVIFSSMALYATPNAAAPPIAFFIVFPLIWLFFMALWVATLII